MDFKITTGNFANVNKYRRAGYHKVSIALSSRYYTGDRFKPLMPDWKYMQAEQEEYTRQFNNGLKKLDARKIGNELHLLSQGKNVVLLCHEKEGDFCHRQLVAKWLEKELKIKVEELGRMGGKTSKPIQFSLF